jgi:hypothetical protein
VARRGIRPACRYAGSQPDTVTCSSSRRLQNTTARVRLAVCDGENGPSHSCCLRWSKSGADVRLERAEAALNGRQVQSVTRSDVGVLYRCRSGACAHWQ